MSAEPERSAPSADRREALLALETSTATADVAVVDRAGALLARRTAVAARHSANLLSLCAEALSEARVELPGLAAIACGAGPGSFTGLRVGMAVAKGLALPFSLPFVAVPSLEALALDLAGELEGASGQGPPTCLAACLDGGKGQIFGAYFTRRSPEEGAGEPPRRDGHPELSPCGETLAAVPAAFLAVAPAGQRRVFAGGPGLALIASPPEGWLLGSRRTPSAGAVAVLAWRRLARGATDDLAAVVPSYGRAPDITTPKRRSGP